MAIIKIISNPYSNSVSYQRWDTDSEEWVPIDAAHNANSALISENYSTGFFPFKAESIVGEILNEFLSPTNDLELKFEGPEDEYRSLVSVCEGNVSGSSIRVSKSSRYLQNARDILPEVVKVFGELRPLIIKSTNDEESVKEDLRKFTDAASNVIPICVVGNYSSGKSTFINALLGAEYLPAGEEPLTAKVYQISRVGQAGGARVGFELDGRKVSLRFDGNEFDAIGLLSDDPMNEKFEKSLEDAGDSLVARVSKALEILNVSVSSSSVDRVSDLITVEVPFSEEGLLGNSQNEFMIFDTPGPNSVSNKKHIDILRGAMENLSNGIPIFVSEYSDLDSTDSEKLYSEVKSIDGLDSRFTMIVVSKADHANLPRNGFSKDGVQKIRDQAVVRSLYAEGIYFVSSLIGLGSKNGGDFLSSYLVREFSMQESMYSDASSRFYTQLYEYDIMPEQIKREALEASRACSNKLFANSGLYCVESEIQTFADKYASYNKCRQLEQSLESASKTATEDTNRETEKLELTRGVLSKSLDVDMNSLSSELVDTCNRLEHAAERGYRAVMDECVGALREHLCAKELKEREAKYFDDAKRIVDLDGEVEDVMEALRVAEDGLQRNVKSIINNHDVSSVKSAKDDFSRDLGKILKEMSEVGEVQGEAKRRTMESLLDNVNASAVESLGYALDSVDKKSKNYWIEQATILRDQLISVVAGASGLTDSARNRLTQVIMTFSPIKFPEHEDFEMDEFIIHPFEMVHKSKLAKAYTDRLNAALSSLDSEIEQSHWESFQTWSQMLLGTLRDNITEFSPELHSQYELIEQQKEEIAQLQDRQEKLQGLVREVQHMIDWKPCKAE